MRGQARAPVRRPPETLRGLGDGSGQWEQRGAEQLGQTMGRGHRPGLLGRGVGVLGFGIGWQKGSCVPAPAYQRPGNLITRPR